MKSAVALWFSLIPRPFPASVFDHLQYAKKSLGDFDDVSAHISRQREEEGP